jgi:hypothetical protein
MVYKLKWSPPVLLKDTGRQYIWHSNADDGAKKHRNLNKIFLHILTWMFQGMSSVGSSDVRVPNSSEGERIQNLPKLICQTPCKQPSMLSTCHAKGCTFLNRQK